MEEDVPTNPSPVMRKVFGLPLIVWVLLVAVVAYLWFSRRRLTGGSGGGGSSSGGGGSATSGNTRIEKGAVTISVSQDPTRARGNHQPKPPVHKKKSIMTTVPDVKGLRYTRAANKLHSAGLNARRVEPYVGTVTKENPGSGEKVKRGSTISLTGKGNALNPGGKGKK